MFDCITYFILKFEYMKRHRGLWLMGYITSKKRRMSDHVLPKKGNVCLDQEGCGLWAEPVTTSPTGTVASWQRTGPAWWSIGLAGNLGVVDGPFLQVRLPAYSLLSGRRERDDGRSKLQASVPVWRTMAASARGRCGGQHGECTSNY